MVAKTVYLTPEGQVALRELDRLLVRRAAELRKRIQEEREFRDFAEGSEPMRTRRTWRSSRRPS